MTRVLVVDNYDSFVYNLVHYLGQLGAECVVRRNDAVTVDEVAGPRVDGVLAVARTGHPEAAGVSVEMVRTCAAPGCRCSGCAWGIRRSGSRTARPYAGLRNCCTARPRWSTTRAPACSRICRIRSPRPATTRWRSTRHTLPPELEATAHTPSGVLMARPAPRPAGRRRAVPSRVGADRRWPPLLANWLVECGDEARLTGWRVGSEWSVGQASRAAAL